MSVTDSLQRFIRTTMKPLDYYAIYEGKVTGSPTDGSFDVQPSDVRLSKLERVPVRWSTPGQACKLNTGTVVIFCFANGDPTLPRIIGFESPGLDKMYLGANDATGAGATDALALASKVKAALDNLQSTFNNHTHTLTPANSPIAVAGAVGNISGTTGAGPAATTSTAVASSKVKAQ
jgi:hypothetical protein